eukprot:jgi/Ulvmu1/4370/UM002_0095.1
MVVRSTCCQADSHTPPVHIDLPCTPLQNLRKDHEDTWNIRRRGWSGNNENNTVEGEPGQGHVLCVAFPKGSLNPSSKRIRPLGGVGFYAAPKAVFPATDVELRYKLQFDPSFEPQLGGKLPGLYMSPAELRDVRGGSGSRHSSGCASVRIMWRAGWQAEAYVYSNSARDSPAYMAQPGCHFNDRYGDSLWRGVLRFQPEVWNEVAVRVRLNAVDGMDGLLQVRVNGSTCKCSQMRWRSLPETVVSAVFVCTFYGGSSEAFACPRDTCVRFKDFAVTKLA